MGDREETDVLLKLEKWQSAQSSTTKAENLENDFTESTSKAEEFWWTEGRDMLLNAGWNRTKVQ